MNNIDYVISTNQTWLDLDVIHAFLSEHSYWARGIPRDVVARSIANSLCFGVYSVENKASNPSRRQVGFARVTTDRATFAYLGDVFILSEHRGRGLSKTSNGSGAQPSGSARVAPLDASRQRTLTSSIANSALGFCLSPSASCSATILTSMSWRPRSWTPRHNPLSKMSRRGRGVLLA
jgi:hypothetical protein